jgi:DNA-binding LytR/AlgR family response regulator
LDLIARQIASANHTKFYKERFMAHLGKSFVVVGQDDIAYFVRDELIYLVTFAKQQFLTDFQTMDEIEEVVDPGKFFRANRQYLINVKAVDSFRTDANSKLEVKLRQPANLTIDVSREKAHQFRRWIQSE